MTTEIDIFKFEQEMRAARNAFADGTAQGDIEVVGEVVENTVQASQVGFVREATRVAIAINPLEYTTVRKMRKGDALFRAIPEQMVSSNLARVVRFELQPPGGGIEEVTYRFETPIRIDGNGVFTKGNTRDARGRPYIGWIPLQKFIFNGSVEARKRLKEIGAEKLTPSKNKIK